MYLWMRPFAWWVIKRPRRLNSRVKRIFSQIFPIYMHFILYCNRLGQHRCTSFSLANNCVIMRNRLNGENILETFLLIIKIENLMLSLYLVPKSDVRSLWPIEEWMMFSPASLVSHCFHRGHYHQALMHFQYLHTPLLHGVSGDLETTTNLSHFPSDIIDILSLQVAGNS